MLYTHKEIIKKYKTNYFLSLAIKKKEVFKITKGIYSLNKNVNYLEVNNKKYHNPIYTMESALFYHMIVTDIPSKDYIASDKNSYKYVDKSIKQYFDNSKLLHVGETTTIYNGVKIRLYNKERMLIEVIRYKNKLPFDYYKQVVQYYRDNINEINIPLVFEYLKKFPKKNFITNILQLEIL